MSRVLTKVQSEETQPCDTGLIKVVKGREEGSSVPLQKGKSGGDRFYKLQGRVQDEQQEVHQDTALEFKVPKCVCK